MPTYSTLTLQRSQVPPSAACGLGNPSKVIARVGGRSRAQVACVATGSGGNAGGGNGAVLVLPGFLFSSKHYAPLVADLRNKGFDAEVVPTATSDWFPALAGASFEWYLGRVDGLLQGMHAKHGRLALVGHSAGGWLARILLGNEPYQGVRYGRASWVHTLLTLGTPHQSIENYPFGRAKESLMGPNIDQAPPGVRWSSLQFVNYFYPDAASFGGMRVVCACGNAIRGRPLFGEGGNSSSNSSSSSNGASLALADGGHFSSPTCVRLGSLDGVDGSMDRPSRWEAYMAYAGYKSGCGRGDVDGDGVTPLCIAHLPGAEHVLLPGVWHTPRQKQGQLWYGDSPVQDLWLQYLAEPQGSPVGPS